jgi:Clp amino terminal domain, pathogenicity island component
MQATVQRAVAYAEEQAHRQVTTEHLLLALTEDADAIAVLQRRGIDVDHMRNEIAGLVSRNTDRFANGETIRLAYGNDFDRVMSIAGGAGSKRRPIDGALMLSALIADGNTPAAELIKLYGLTFEDASRTSRSYVAAPAVPSLASVRSTAREAALGYRNRTAGLPPFVSGAPPDLPDRNGAAFSDQSWSDGYLDPPPEDHQAGQTADPDWQADGAAGNWNGYDYPDANADYDGAAQQPLAAPPPQPTRQTDGSVAPRPKARRSLSRARADRNTILQENIPRRIVTGLSHVVEARIDRKDIEATVLEMRMPGGNIDSGAPVTHAITVRLRSPDGTFAIEPGTPETQWVEGLLGLLQDDFASWRWTVTPTSTGKTALQLVVSVRAVTPEGLMGEIALPEQTVGIAVLTNYMTILKRLLRWLFVLALPLGIGAAGEHYFHVVSRLIGR